MEYRPGIRVMAHFRDSCMDAIICGDSNTTVESWQSAAAISCTVDVFEQGG